MELGRLTLGSDAPRKHYVADDHAVRTKEYISTWENTIIKSVALKPDLILGTDTNFND